MGRPASAFAVARLRPLRPAWAQVFYGACTYLHPYVDDDDDDRGLCSARDGRLDGSGAAGGGGQHRRRQERERSRSAQNFGLLLLLLYYYYYIIDTTTALLLTGYSERTESLL